jgi:flagellar biosynthetic protein FliR
MSPAAGVSVLAAASLPEFWAPFRDWLGLRHGFSDALQLFALGFARWAPVTSLTPFLGGRLVPGTVRIGLAFMLALWVVPGTSAASAAPLAISSIAFYALLLKELLVGFVLAFSASLVFWAAEMGGRFIDNVRGTTTANLLIPQVSTQSSLLGDFYFQLFVVLYVIAGGHRWFLGAVFRSYEAVPPLAPGLRTAGLARDFIAATADLLVVALQIMAPALIVLMLMDLMLGVANRMAPQLDVFFISLSLQASVGALVVALSLYHLLGMTPDLFRRQHGWLDRAVEDMRTAPAPAVP